MSTTKKIIFGTIAVVCGLLMCSGMLATVLDGLN